MLSLLLSLPSFAFFLFVLYWSPVLAALTGYVKWWKLWGTRNDTEGIAEFLMAACGVHAVVTGPRRLYRGPHTIYLPNHRSFADFSIDQRLTESRGATLSRSAVALAFPLVMAVSAAGRSVILFVRGGRRVREKEVFNTWLDTKLSKSSCSSFLIYPEGHRSTRPESLSLKRGMLRYAYARKMKVQAIISANKEAVLSEKHLRARFGQTVVVGFGNAIDSTSFADFEDFMAALEQDWEAVWKEVFAADPKGLPELPPAVIDMNPSIWLRLRTGAVLVAFMACLLWMTRFFVNQAAWAAALLGPTAAMVAGAVLVVWVAASVYACSRPYDARKHFKKQKVVAAPTAPADAVVADAVAKKEG